METSVRDQLPIQIINPINNQSAISNGRSAQANMYSRYGSSLPNIYDKSTIRRGYNNNSTNRANETRSAISKSSIQESETKE